MIKQISSLELISYIKDSKNENVFYWVGAGISHDAPTCIPLGREMCEILLKMMLKDDYNYFIKTYQDLAISLCDESMFPRLEFIFQILKDMYNNVNNINGEQYSNYFDYIKIFDLDEYNDNHCYLSKLINDGCTIITSNFDMCIEKALNKSFDKRIIHFHGTYKDGMKMGIVLDSVQYMNSQFCNELTNIISCEDNIIVFLGYSMSDDLDINPFLINKKSNIKCKCFYVEHNDGSKSDLTTRVKRILEESFPNPVYCIEKTSFLLGALSNSTKQTQKMKGFNGFSYNFEKKHKGKFINEEATKLLIFERIGIKLDGVSIGNQIEKKDGILSKPMKHYSEDYSETHQTSEIESATITTNKISEMENKLNEDDWQNINRACFEAYKEISDNKKEMLINIDKILKLIDNYRSCFGFDYKSDKTLSRNKAVLSCYKHRDFEEARIELERVFNDYKSLGWIDGMIGVKIDLLLCMKICNLENSVIFKNEKEKIEKIITNFPIRNHHAANYSRLINTNERI